MSFATDPYAMITLEPKSTMREYDRIMIVCPSCGGRSLAYSGYSSVSDLIELWHAHIRQAHGLHPSDTAGWHAPDPCRISVKT